MTPQAHPRRRVGQSVVATAWLNVGLHAAGLILAAVFMRPGSPLTPLSERLTYLASQPIGWTITWAVWAACSVAMVSFAYVVAVQLGAKLARRAFIVAAAAAIVDLACDARYAYSFPTLASEIDPTAQTFLAAERSTNFVSLTIANGLYSVSTLLSTLALRGRPGLIPGTIGVGIAVFISGLALAAAGVIESPDLAFWATPPTIGLYCVWVLLAARSLTRGGAEP
jgi:hypothetical protein